MAKKKTKMIWDGRHYRTCKRWTRVLYSWVIALSILLFFMPNEINASGYILCQLTALCTLIFSSYLLYCSQKDKIYTEKRMLPETIGFGLLLLVFAIEPVFEGRIPLTEGLLFAFVIIQIVFVFFYRVSSIKDFIKDGEERLKFEGKI